MMPRLRLILVCNALVVLANAALSQGEYQRARDDKTIIWNGTPKSGESVAWDGGRDKEDYATGFGALTWYTAKGKVYALYYGNMVHGKFEGAVNVHSNGKTAHAYFVDGGRVSGWARGPAPSKMALPEGVLEKAERRAQKAAETTPTAPPEKKKENVERAPTPKPIVSKPIASPAERTPPAVAEKKTRPATEKTENAASAFEATPIPKIAESSEPSIQETPSRAEAPAAEHVTEMSPPLPETTPGPVVKKETPADVSVSALVGPPSSLRTTQETSPEKSSAQSSSSEGEHLSEAEAISLADAEARTQGYHLDDYERPKADYSAVKRKWTLSYDLKKSADRREEAAPLSASVEDKTRKVEIRK